MNEYLLDRYGRKISIFLSDGEKEVNLYKPCLEFFKKELTNSNNTKNIIKKC
ncbi:MAG: hypothetical protein QW735_01075 [archaeon]